MAKPFASLNYSSHFLQLPKIFYHEQVALGLEQPEWVCYSKSCADWLGLEQASLQDQETLDLLSGNTSLPQWRPLAMKYFGHQFGYLNPDLGDGRGLLLAEVENESGELIDLHLKGAGTTPYSRDGDGRAVLRSSVREFLCSEAMIALGIPSSRALCVINSQTPVQRETEETGATLLRATKTHIRFGHFEFAYHSGQESLLRSLADYVIARYFPSLKGSPNQYADFFQGVCEHTAQMIAQWQCIGFAHGVMNTDNMSILGETFDYGPFGFMGSFDAGYVCNHSDHQGRYAFDRQPAIGHWNLSVLAQALSPLIDRDGLTQGLQRYSTTFNETFLAGMHKKLGLEQHNNDPDSTNQNFIMQTLNMLQGSRLDYSYFFRALSEWQAEDDPTLSDLRDMCLDPINFDTWVQAYQDRLHSDARPARQRLAEMQQTNPCYILRNHLAENAIEKAKAGDYSEIKRLHKALENPFQRREEFEDLSALPPDWAASIAVSCSS